jgi:hypothetical protein
MKELCRAWRSDRRPLFCGLSDHLGSRLDCQSLYWWWYDRLGSWSDRQPLFWAQSDRLGVRLNRQLRPAMETLEEREAPVVV